MSSAKRVLGRGLADLIPVGGGAANYLNGGEREIGAGLVAIIKACKTDDLQELETKLISRRSREVAKAKATGSASSVAAIEDKYDCLNIFLRNEDSVDSLCDSILSLFDDSARGLLTLSTIHKAKGLEWEKVFLLDFHTLLPSKWATQLWQQAQEKNLQYVAVTRAKLDLVFINRFLFNGSEVLF